MQLVGQNVNLEIIKNWVELPQFIIIQGDKHTGKTAMVLYLCDKYKLNYIKVGNSVNEIKNLIKLMTPNSNTLYHFKNFDKASIQAKNALLKITEEPIAGNYIAITGSRQLPTLESRARKIVLAPYTEQDLVNCYNRYGFNMEMQHKLYSVGINTPTKIQLYCGYDKIEELTNYALDIFHRITCISLVDILKVVNMFENKVDNTQLDVSYLFLDMLIHIIETSMIKSTSNRSRIQYGYFRQLEILINAKESIDYNYTISRRLLLYRVFYALYKGGANYEKDRGLKTGNIK